MFDPAPLQLPFAATVSPPFPGFAQHEMNAEQVPPPQSALVLQFGIELQLHWQKPRNFLNAWSEGAFDTAVLPASLRVETALCVCAKADWGTPTLWIRDEPSKVGAERAIAIAKTTTAATYISSLFTGASLKFLEHLGPWADGAGQLPGSPYNAADLQGQLKCASSYVYSVPIWNSSVARQERCFTTHAVRQIIPWGTCRTRANSAFGEICTDAEFD